MIVDNYGLMFVTYIVFYVKDESHFSVLPLRFTPSPCPSKLSGKR